MKIYLCDQKIYLCDRCGKPANSVIWLYRVGDLCLDCYLLERASHDFDNITKSGLLTRSVGTA